MAVIGAELPIGQILLLSREYPVLSVGAVRLACACCRSHSRKTETCSGGRLNDTNASEVNGFLKLLRPLFWPQLLFSQGAVHLVPGYWPEIDAETLAACTVASERYTISRFAFAAASS
jgi:hypothetical protein